MNLSDLPERYRLQALEQIARSNRIRAISTSIRKDDDSKKTSNSEKPRRKATLTPDKAEGLVRKVSESKDGNTLSITLDLDPATLPTAQQKGVFVDKKGHVHFFTKKKVADAEKALVKALSPYGGISGKWGQVPYGVQIQFRFGYPSSTPEKNRLAVGEMLQRSDADNIFKGLGDAMTEAGFWQDDSLIAALHLYKYRSTLPPAVKITITNLKPVFNRLAALKADPIDRTAALVQTDLFTDIFDPLSFPPSQPRETL